MILSAELKLVVLTLVVYFPVSHLSDSRLAIHFHEAETSS